MSGAPRRYAGVPDHHAGIDAPAARLHSCNLITLGMFFYQEQHSRVISKVLKIKRTRENALRCITTHVFELLNIVYGKGNT